MRYKVKPSDDALFLKVLEALKLTKAVIKLASEKRRMVSIEDPSSETREALSLLGATLTMEQKMHHDSS